MNSRAAAILIAGRRHWVTIPPRPREEHVEGHLQGNGPIVKAGKPGDRTGPQPPDFIPGHSQPGLLLICDHASNFVPAEYDGLGLEEAVLGEHVALDIGAGPLTRQLAQALDAPAVLATTSRLVIDCNRNPGDPDSIPEKSHGVAIPGNTGLSSAEAQLREARFFRPYHDRVAELLDQMEPAATPAAVVSIHSFTPYLDEERPWHIGVLWDRDQRLADPLLAALSHQAELVVGANQPYSGYSPLGYSCQTHGDAKGRPNVIFEVRQDLIDSPDGVKAMAAILGPAITDIMANHRPLNRLPHQVR